MKNKKVLHIIPGYGGGISSYVKNLINGISRDNIRMDVVSFSEYDDSFKRVVEKKGGKTYSIPSVHSGFTKMIKAYSKILKDNNYDVIHCHISGYKGLFFMALARAFKIPEIFVHAHRTSDEKKGRFHGLSVRFSQFTTTCLATNYFACSQMAGDFIFGDRIRNTYQIEKMPNSIDVKKFVRKLPSTKKMEYFKDLSIGEHSLVIGHVGRFNIQKNHEFMIQIINELKVRNIDFVWLFIGEGSLETQIKKRVEELELDKYVRFLGRREDVSDLLQIFDIFVLPSLFEGLPTVAIESQAAGVPTILSDTITTEADMELGIVEFLAIQNDKVDHWVNCILGYEKFCIPIDEERISKMESNGFTLDALGKKYENILLNK